MQILSESEIQANEIDHLGHMNVRFYMERANAANWTLMDSFGLGADALAGRGALLIQKDSYVRYHREQFQGSTLAVKGGVLAASPDAIRLYFELVNDAKAQVAATFIMVGSPTMTAPGRGSSLPNRAMTSSEPRQVVSSS